MPWSQGWVRRLSANLMKSIRNGNKKLLALGALVVSCLARNSLAPSFGAPLACVLALAIRYNLSSLAPNDLIALLCIPRHQEGRVWPEAGRRPAFRRRHGRRFFAPDSRSTARRRRHSHRAATRAPISSTSSSSASMRTAMIVETYRLLACGDIGSLEADGTRPKGWRQGRQRPGRRLPQPGEGARQVRRHGARARRRPRH